MEVPKYGSPITYPDKRLHLLLEDEVVVQEKVDGSQMSFMLTGEGEVIFRSRGGQISKDFDQVQDLFKPAVRNILDHKDELASGWVYRGEAIKAKRHNKLVYERVPKGNFVLFDVVSLDGLYHVRYLEGIAARLGVEAVQTFYHGNLDKDTLEEVWKEALEKGSMLGGPLEGVVIKNYEEAHPNTGDVPLTAKLVTAEFKESMNRPAKDPFKKSYAVPQTILDSLNYSAIWSKAIIHLAEEGKLTNSPADIGPLMKEISRDFEETNKQGLQEALYACFRKQILRSVTSGFPDYYKRALAEEGDE